MKLLRSVLLGCLCLAQLSFADSAAPSLLEILSQQNAAIEKVQGTFQQTKTIAVLPAPLKSQGEFRFAHDQGLVWHTTAPVEQLIELDAKGQYLSDSQFFAQGGKGAKQAQVFSQLFLGVFSGDLAVLQKYFVIEAKGTPEAWQLNLTPNASQIAQYIEGIEISGGATTEHIRIAETNGDRSDIALTEQQVSFKEPN